LSSAPIPFDESTRLASLVELGILDSAPEREFDALVQAAALVCDAPISLISLIDVNRQWFKANVGLPGVTETPRELAFCAHAILQDGIFEVADARLDPRFEDNGLVTGEPNIRFYAGASLRLSDGSHAGTLCVIDRQPRQLNAKQREVLSHLAAAAERALEGRRALLAERELRETASRAAAVLHNSLDAIVTLSLDGTVSHWNAAAQRLFGYSPAEMLGQPVAKLVPPYRAEEQKNLATSLRDSLTGFNFESIRMHRDGEAIAVSISLAPIRNARGELTGATKVIRDIREQARAAQVLAESEARFKALSERLASIIEGTGAGTWEWNVQTGETKVNERWAAMLGWSLAEMGPVTNEFMASIGHPDELAQIRGLLNEHFAGHTDSFVRESRLRHRDGSWVWIEDRGRLVSRTPDGRPEWVFGMHMDISERKRRDEALRKSEALLNRTGEVAGVGGWELDLLTGTVWWSAETRRIHAVAPDYVPALSEAINFYATEARPVIQAAVERAMTSADGWDLELPLIRATGQRIWVRAVGAAEFEDGKPVRLVGAFQDITLLRSVSAELAEQHQLLRVTLQSIGDAVITTNSSGIVTWLNPVAERMTGWLNTQAKGYPVEQVFHIVNEETREPAENPVARCLQQGKVAGSAKRTVLISRQGEEFGIEDSASPIRHEGGDMLGVVLVFHDVTEQRRLSGEMSYRATHDALTGLVNRAEFETRLSRALRKAHDDRSEHALLFIDLDQFKLVNDACGHSVGDQLLKQVSKLLGETVRTRDTLARLGGDEFGVILEQCSAEKAQRVAQQICERMDDFRFMHDERRFRIGASIGLVPVDSRWPTTAAVLQAADSACYAAKDAGRNRVHTWFDTDQAMRARQGEMQWAARLEQALDENRFVLYAQRIEALSPQSHGLHAEVLLRMIDIDGSIVQPGAFLPAAERFHFASRIDRWVLRHAIAALSPLVNRASVDTLCVNLSGQSIGDRAFHREALDTLSQAGHELCRQLCLEITETAAVTNMADASVFIDQVRALGVRIALDDFGAGASSFGYLKSLKVDLIKIDGQYIRDLIDDPLDDAAVRCFVDVARVVGIQTVAEFVDRPEVLARVREIGIDFAQGFLLHRPEPLEAVLGAQAVMQRLAPAHSA
jgi:diguanylate cyclase (GGDEF)-like protein/PAS domain S-box-containing protein